MGCIIFHRVDIDRSCGIFVCYMYPNCDNTVTTLPIPHGAYFVCKIDHTCISVMTYHSHITLSDCKYFHSRFILR